MLKSKFSESLLRKDLPKGWTLVPMGSVLTSTEYGLSEPTSPEGNVPIIGMKDLTDGVVYERGSGKIHGCPEKLVGMTLSKGDILLNRTNSPDLVGKVGIVRKDTPAVFASYLVRLNVDLKRADPEFVNYWLNSWSAQVALKRISTRAVSQANVNPTEFKRFCPIPLPPLSEQREIARILRTWDEAIDAASHLIDAKRKCFCGMRQHMLGRGGDFPKAWPRKRLSEISTRVRRTNDGGSHPVMTISAKSGFMMQGDKFSRDMAGSSLEKYTQLHEGEFAYNKGNSKTAPYGCVFALDRPTAVVPFVYFCFSLKPGLDHAFYQHLFAAGALDHQLSRVINSGVRNDGLLNLNVADFFACRVPVPPLDEQKRIATVLTEAKEELALLESKRDTLKRQKRGLMQKLLTGEWRVSEVSVG